MAGIKKKEGVGGFKDKFSTKTNKLPNIKRIENGN